MLERLKAGEAAQVAKFFDDEVLPDLLAQLGARVALIDERGFDLGPKTTQRLRDMIESMQSTVDAWSTGLAADLKEKASAIGVAEVAWQDEALKAVLPFAWDTVIPATQMIAAAVTKSPIDGVLLADVVGRLDAGVKGHLERAIRIGIAEGEGIDKIARRVRDVTDFSRNSAEAVTRTAVGHASNMGRAAYYEENADLIRGVQWVATLDSRTCASCGALDGKVFETGKGGPRPPRHISCRCTTVPVLRPLRELGLPIDSFPVSTRASMNGQVSGSETYSTWLAKMPASIQDEALGVRRAELFRTGKLKVDSFVGRAGDPYTLDELRRRERAAWKAAGMDAPAPAPRAAPTPAPTPKPAPAPKPKAAPAAPAGRVTTAELEAIGWTPFPSHTADGLKLFEQLGVKPQDLFASMTGKLGATNVRFAAKLSPTNPRYGKAQIAGSLTDAKGKVVGEINRVITIAPEGRSVEHVLFRLNKSAQGGGSAKAALKSSVAAYKKAGMKRIDVHAGLDVGGFTWARFGFVPRQQYWDRMRARTLLGKLDDMLDGGTIPQSTYDRMTSVLELSDPRAMWKIADATELVDGVPLGKALLLESDWIGMLDLSDAATMARFDRYVGN